MLTKTIDVRLTRPPLQELLSQVLAGIEIVFAEDSKPIARLVPILSRTAGLHAGKIWTSDDFKEPLPDEFWTGEA